MSMGKIRLGKFFEFWQNTREIISWFHEEYTIWLPFNIMGEKLRSELWVFYLFIVSINVAIAIL